MNYFYTSTKIKAILRLKPFATQAWVFFNDLVILWEYNQSDQPSQQCVCKYSL